MFSDHNSLCLHVPIGEGIWMEVAVVLKFWCTERKHGPSPALVEFPTATKKIMKIKRTLKKLAPDASSTAALPPPLFVDTSLDDISLVQHITSQSCAQTLEGRTDSLEGATFTRSFSPLEEYLVGLNEGL